MVGHVSNHHFGCRVSVGGECWISPIMGTCEKPYLMSLLDQRRDGMRSNETSPTRDQDPHRAVLLGTSDRTRRGMDVVTLGQGTGRVGKTSAAQGVLEQARQVAGAGVGNKAGDLATDVVRPAIGDKPCRLGRHVELA